MNTGCKKPFTKLIKNPATARVVSLLIILIFISVSPSLAEINLRVRVLEKYHPVNINIEYDKSIYEYENINLKNKFPIEFPLQTKYKISIPELKFERFYEGSLKILKKNNELLVINIVPIENYVASVVLSEAGMVQPEAMCAQAVISRTWAINHINNKNHYDFNDLTSSQSYQGFYHSVERSKIIIAKTEGEILTFEDKPAKILYHAQCSDRVFSAYEIWGGENIPYLSSTTLPSFAKNEGKSALWEIKIKKQILDEIITGKRRNNKETFYKVEKVNGKLLVNTGLSKVGIDTFRLAVNKKLGWMTLKSNDFHIVKEKDTLIFSGKGFGHLVGLCQVEAGNLAESGWDYGKILKLFFPGTEIEQKY